MPRRLILFILSALMLFLGVYTWDQRTGQWDRLSTSVGLELSGGVMRLLNGVEDSVSGFWETYVDLRDVKARNTALEQRVRELEKRLADTSEELAELARLRRLMHLGYPMAWPAVASRVLAQRMGPNAALDTVMLSSGYLSGAAPGTPVTSWQGVVGRVLKAGPGTSVVLLLTDTGSRVSVLTSEGRVQGILAGGGPGHPLELRFVRQNAPIRVGEILITSGVDAAYPKGIPVARVTAVSREGASRSGASLLEIQAEPLADVLHLEEVFLLQRPQDSVIPDDSTVYTRRAPTLEKPRLGAEADTVGRSLP
ncbi:rod shape-determining protein MreC [Mailhella sp.]|uniref:rod shape-determining protein MreC n=1 Tax=Mailhella sp. TaxID=1981029 RepID=UPI0040631D70